jgi:large subunit ribosomal protein L24
MGKKKKIEVSVSKMKIHKGDQVIVTTGKDKGKTGKVLRAMPKDLKVLVAGINTVKKHTKPSRDSDGGILVKEMPIHVSNVAHVDPKSGKATKVAIKILKDGAKARVAKKSGEMINNVEGK